MTKKSKRNDQFEAEKAKRLRTAKGKLLDGSISAISVDTCIFTANDYRLDKGLLKHLEQFKDNTFELIFSEITIKEVISHIANNSDQAKIKLRSALREVGKYWQEQVGKEAVVIDGLLGTEPVKELATKKLKDFVSRCGASVIKTNTTLDIDELLKMYFDLQPPFETSADKKSEFPDAMALLSLESWAKKHHKPMLFVTNDKGCMRFCEGSDYLYSIDSLTSALSVIQERDTHLLSLCKKLEANVIKGNYPHLISEIETTIADNIWLIDWELEADSYCYYDADLDEIDLISATFAGSHGKPEFNVMDYRDDKLVVQVAMQLKLDASCIFSFSVKDGFDHDMVNIGGALVSVEQSVKVDVLLTFEDLKIETPDVTEIELVYCRRTIDFGSVGPDFSDEAPDSEYH